MRTRQALHGFLSRHMMAHVRSLRGMGLYHSLLHTTTTGHQPTFVNASAARLSRWEHRLLATKRPCPMRRTNSIYTYHDHHTWHLNHLHINPHSCRFLKHLLSIALITPRTGSEAERKHRVRATRGRGPAYKHTSTLALWA